jgi:hypothetical protein
MSIAKTCPLKLVQSSEHMIGRNHNLPSMQLRFEIRLFQRYRVRLTNDLL